MSKIRMMYFEKDDVLHLAISDEPEAGSVELGPNITVELNGKGELIGIEILEASRFIRDSIMESVQARVLRVPEFQPAWQVGDTRMLSS
ncbi:MAG: DNA polymerase III subunit alpha [Chloroflexi bacterium HGW-Chloroflexi-1]|nr:MAG: DNA polymerase III subunit alpha [Chloroflexi bacterium HGW-Chloroflexi-1]